MWYLWQGIYLLATFVNKIISSWFCKYEHDSLSIYMIPVSSLAQITKSSEKLVFYNWFMESCFQFYFLKMTPNEM
jgi:hypothetical protein